MTSSTIKLVSEEKTIATLSTLASFLAERLAEQNLERKPTAGFRKETTDPAPLSATATDLVQMIERWNDAHRYVALDLRDGRVRFYGTIFCSLRFGIEIDVAVEDRERLDIRFLLR